MNRHKYEHGIMEFTRYVDGLVEGLAPWLCGATVLYLVWHIGRACGNG